MGKIKIYDWRLNAAAAAADEQNAAILSVKIANVNGMASVITAFNAIAKTIKARENFNALALAGLAADVFCSLYSCFKQFK